MFLATSDRSSEMNILLRYSQVHQKYSWPLPIIPFHLFLSDSSRICSCPWTGLLGHKPSPLNLNSNSGVNWPPQYSISIIGKFLTSRQINFRAAKNLLRSVQKMGNNLRIINVRDGLFQFKFSLESQLRWVMDNGL